MIARLAGRPPGWLSGPAREVAREVHGQHPDAVPGGLVPGAASGRAAPRDRGRGRADAAARAPTDFPARRDELELRDLGDGDARGAGCDPPHPAVVPLHDDHRDADHPAPRRGGLPAAVRRDPGAVTGGSGAPDGATPYRLTYPRVYSSDDGESHFADVVDMTAGAYVAGAGRDHA